MKIINNVYANIHIIDIQLNLAVRVPHCTSNLLNKLRLESIFVLKYEQDS